MDRNIKISFLFWELSFNLVKDIFSFIPRIKFSATVTIIDEDTDEEKIYQIVGEPEANIENNKLNVKSPLARALIGKDMGDSVEVRSPGGTKHYEITNIEYI